ncbi:MAG TPA: LON peptidase substrate-binding domain-containing protein [Fimbriimonadaceae bacterium]|nr:LON peptidase substrate-binding domain-containing protein [Fimbriimonadaceae bacterium]
MATPLEELALFPLDTVVFPYAQLQMRVLEPKYVDLVRYCVQHDKGFGIVLRKESEGDDPYLVGTEVRIDRTETLGEGEIEVRVRGQRRFRVRRLDYGSKPFLTGLVEQIVELEVEDTPRVDALTYRLRECVEEYIRVEFRHYDVNIQQVELPPDPTALSFIVANLLKLENIEKQRLLETTDTIERLSEIVPLLQRQIVDSRTTGPFRATPSMLTEWINPN